MSNWKNYDRLSSENRSIFARRAETAVKLLIKKGGGRIVKSKKGRSEEKIRWSSEERGRPSTRATVSKSEKGYSRQVGKRV